MGATNGVSEQSSNVFSLRLGEFRVTAILDTFTPLPLDTMIGRSMEELRRIQAGGARHPLEHVSINCFLVEGADFRALIDTGTGGEPGTNAARLQRELQGLGVKAQDITHILFTHLHVDHAGGLLNRNGKPVFDNARLIAHRRERDHWFGSVPTDANELTQQFFEFAKTIRPLFSTALWLEDDSQVPIPGISLVPLPGHTPGHCGYRLSSGGKSLLIWGDIVHRPDFQFGHPDIGMTFDSDPAKARAQRQSLFAEVAASGELVAGLHFDFPPFGHLHTQPDGGFRLYQVLWSAAASA